MNYQFDFVCTYKSMDTLEDQEQLYRIQLLQAFELENCNEFEINDTIIELFSILYLNDDFKAIIKKARINDNIVKMAETLNMECAEDNIFTVLFNYDYFDLLHSCIGDIFMNKVIHPTHLTNIMNAL